MSKVNITNVIDIPSTLEVLPIVLEIGKETFVLVIVYHATSPVGFLIDGFILLMNELSTQYRILIVGNFNLDQFFSKIVVKIAPLIQNLNLSRHSQYSPHIVWGNIRSCI